MTKPLISLAALLALAAPAAAQEEAPPPSPNQIVAEAPAEEWVAIAPEDLLVMTLAPAADGSERKVVIQLMPAPFSQGWVENIRTLARAQWYDGISVNRVQDNYVVQWGDANYDNPEADGAAKQLPDGLKVMKESEYTVSSFVPSGSSDRDELQGAATVTGLIAAGVDIDELTAQPKATQAAVARQSLADRYSRFAAFTRGWPIAGHDEEFWPVHCYGMVGVGRGYSPDTGSGAELYTVIGHAPRHLDRNIALVGRVVEGIEHLSSLPRGKGQLGFYEDPAKRVPILTVRVASDLPEGDRPVFEYLSTEGDTFARYADARANRRDPFFIVPAGGADICNIPVPVRRVGD